MIDSHELQKGYSWPRPVHQQRQSRIDTALRHTKLFLRNTIPKAQLDMVGVQVSIIMAATLTSVATHTITIPPAAPQYGKHPARSTG
jgi:hypothetical protein